MVGGGRDRSTGTRPVDVVLVGDEGTGGGADGTVSWSRGIPRIAAPDGSAAPVHSVWPGWSPKWTVAR